MLTSIRLKRFNPQIWLPTLTLLWGIVTICQGFVTNQAGLLGIRFCEFLPFMCVDTSAEYDTHYFLVFKVLGMTEAGLFPGVIYVFSIYYKRRERGPRVAIFFGGAALAGAFGGMREAKISSYLAHMVCCL